MYTLNYDDFIFPLSDDNNATPQLVLLRQSRNLCSNIRHGFTLRILLRCECLSLLLII